MSYSAEYTAPTVRYGGCSYSKLKNYNQGMPGTAPPLDNTLTPPMSPTIVPKYCPNSPGVLAYPPRYDALQHGQPVPSCNGKFNILSAYPAAASGQCATTFVKRDCLMPNACGGGY